MAGGGKADPPEAGRRPTRPTAGGAYDLQAPRLTLPDADDVGAEEERANGEPGSGRHTQPLDAWNEDRIRRSSFPPEGEAGRWATRRLAPPRPAEVDPADGHDQGGALELVQRSSSTTHPSIDLRAEMEERFTLDDFSGALRFAEFLLGRDPNDPVAQHYAAASRRRLEQMLYARLTQRGTVPLVAVQDSDIRWLGLDSRAAWLLSRVDGSSDCDTLLEGAAVERLEGLKLLNQLLEVGAIRMR